MNKLKRILIVLLMGVIVSAIEMTSKLGLFIFFSIGVAITMFSFIVFRRVKFLRNSGMCFGALFIILPLLSTAGIWLGMIGALLLLFFTKDTFSIASFSGIFSKKGRQEYIFVDSHEDTPTPGEIHRYENVIVIRKGFGRVRILVPYGVGVMIHHHAFGGQVEFEGQTYALSNESIQLYSSGYNRSTKKIKIYTTIVAGKIEVIEA